MRMGGQDKGLIELGGRPMVEYVLDALRGQAARVLISANRNLHAYQRYGVTVVPDRQRGFLGPLAGMAGMMAVADTEWLLTVPCDSPRVARDLGLRLWRAVAREDADIAVADDGTRLQPIFALLRCDLRGRLEAYLAAGGRTVDRWCRQQRLACADFSDCPEMFINVNTPEQRDQLARQLAGDRQRGLRCGP
jgi:molybdenum cofactor guanylyltransferase